MLYKSDALINFRNLAKEELGKMDSIIGLRLEKKEKLVQDITYHIINSGGKRLRPILSILSAKLFGYNGERHINLSAAVEFIHTATLLHDDVVDHSNLRRGKPTANKNWDNKSSILVGDFLFSQSFRLMAEDGDIEVLEILSKAASVIAEGEVRQLASISNLNLTVDSYVEIISAKTAELFAAACQVGAVVASADELTKKNMYNFGLNLGMAFQVMDDVLDYVANIDNLGKNIGDDFYEGKVTLPVIIAYQHSDSFEKQLWLEIFAKRQRDSKDFKKVLDIIALHKAIEKSINFAKQAVSEAKRCLINVPENQIKHALIDVLDFCLEREF